MFEFDAPPVGLNLSAIATESGLLIAIDAQAKKIETAMREGKLPSKDEIRLISFLVGEVKRRIASLSHEQAAEFEALKKKADMREVRRWVKELATDAEDLLKGFQNADVGLSWSRFSSAEVRLTNGQARAVGEHWDADLVAILKEADANLRKIKGLSRANISLPQF
nr:uncharacterized protein [uncultured bacterium]